MEYDNKGQIALWGKDANAGEKAPSAKGYFFAHRDIKAGEKVEVALWNNDKRENPNAPLMKGKVSDPYKKEESNFEPAPEGDIPF